MPQICLATIYSQNTTAHNNSSHNMSAESISFQSISSQRISLQSISFQSISFQSISFYKCESQSKVEDSHLPASIFSPTIDLGQRPSVAFLRIGWFKTGFREQYLCQRTLEEAPKGWWLVSGTGPEQSSCATSVHSLTVCSASKWEQCTLQCAARKVCRVLV